MSIVLLKISLTHIHVYTQMYLPSRPMHAENIYNQNRKPCFIKTVTVMKLSIIIMDISSHDLNCNTIQCGTM